MKGFLDEQLSGSNIKIVASESPIALKSSEKLDHALSYSNEIEEAEMDNEAIKNDEYTPIEADKNNDHPAIEDEEDDDYIPLETNTSSDGNNSSIGNDEVMDDTSRVQKKRRKKAAFCKTPGPSLRGSADTNVLQLPELCEDEYCPFDQPSDTNEGDSDYKGMSSSPQVSTSMS
ncbi:hypothetical protein ILUMI_09878 [Ignelater luminosus]|uniref:Uncharacterized protein n=1 Tax=Ignelater luminosus TaxID=2038154 RepID=A0A8K0D4A4_IGNLU|nr:hypothetical protein ILUMI_09878 [Ignelater luminosus]